MSIRVIATLFGMIAFAGSGTAGPIDPSIRPVSRGTTQDEIVAVASLVAPQKSLRPTLRPSASTPHKNVIPVTTKDGFGAWIKQFRTRALRQGISAATFDQSFANVRYDADVIKRDRNQSEFTKTIWDYLDTAASDLRVSNGKAALRKHRDLLNRIETQYDVDMDVVVAIWGLESAYGTFRGSNSVINSLATLAFDARRSDFFEDQLIDALRILENGDVTLANFKGSWAGAMGHTQFIPSSFHSLAVDFTGDGKRDIWSNDPDDALASTANYLAKNGWVKGVPWGVEVTIPSEFDYTQANREILKLPSEWGKIGILGTDGAPVPDHGQASVLLPAGAKGAAFLVFKNFDVIETYNTADAYVIGVGHLSDRISGAGSIQSDWPREDRALSFAERIEMQKRLTARGFDTKKIDGKIGPLTINAVREFQLSEGDIPDGYASLRLLQKLR